jgi:hypothetical protein
LQTAIHADNDERKEHDASSQSEHDDESIHCWYDSPILYRKLGYQWK